VVLMASMVKSCAISGVDGYIVDVETKTMVGQPMISIVGLGDTAIKEARERVKKDIISALMSRDMDKDSVQMTIVKD